MKIVPPDQAYLYAYDLGKSVFPDDFYITKNFSWNEAFGKCPEVPCLWVFYNILKTARELQKVRFKINAPFTITSWYRSPIYNKKIGSTAETSCHTFGNAVDFTVTGIPANNARSIILGMKLPVRLEDKVNWVHLDTGHPFIVNGYKYGLIQG